MAEISSDLYAVNFHDIVTYEKTIFSDEIPLTPDEEDEQEHAFIVEINRAVSMACEKVFYHWTVMRDIYGQAGQALMAALASLQKLSYKDLLRLKGCSEVSIEECLFDLEILKFYIDQENTGSYSGNLAIIFSAIVNGIKGIDLPELQGDSLYQAIIVLQEFLATNRCDINFRNNFVIYKSTLHKKCLSMAQFVAFLNAFSNVLGIRSGSISKSLHSDVTLHDGRALSAEVGHGFVDFVGVELGEYLPEDPELREPEVLRRLTLAYAIRKEAESYEVTDLIKVALDKAQGEPIRIYIWELKVLNDGATEKEMQDYITQVSGYIEKLKVALAANSDIDESKVELVSGLVIVMPDKVKIIGDISNYLFSSRLAEILRSLDSEATLFDRTHFEAKPAELVQEESQVYAAEQFQDAEVPILVLEEERTAGEAEWLTFQSEGITVIEKDTQIDQSELAVIYAYEGLLFVKNNGVIWVNAGWSEEAINEAREHGFNVMITESNVRPPQHLAESWELTFRFPRPNDNLLSMLRSEPREIPDIPEDRKDLMLLTAEKNGTMLHHSLTIEEGRNFHNRRTVLEQRIKATSKPKRKSGRSSTIGQECYQQQLIEVEQ